MRHRTKTNIWFIAALPGLIWTGPAMSTERLFYLGLKGAQVKAESKKADYDDAVIAGVVLGYRFMRKEGRTGAVEIELTDTVSDGNVFEKGITGRWDINTAAIYAAYRGAGEFYFKGRAGLIHANATVSNSIVNKFRHATGPSIGVGFGWKAGKHRFFEIGYTLIELDITYLSLGYHFDL